MAQWWSGVVANITLADSVIIPPGPRTILDDFVQKGLRFEPLHIASVRADWGHFLEQHDTLSMDMFEGRGWC